MLPVNFRQFAGAAVSGGKTQIFLDDFSGGLGTWGFSGTASVSVVSGVAQVTNVSDFSQRASRAFTAVVGAVYQLEFDLDTASANARIAIVEAASPFGFISDLIQSTASLTSQTLRFTATQTGHLIYVIPYSGNASQVVRFDNVALYKL